VQVRRAPARAGAALHLTSVQSNSGGGQQKKPTTNTSGGGGYGTNGRSGGGYGNNGKKKWQPKKPGGYQTSFSGYQQGGKPRPTGPLFCFSPGAGLQQQQPGGGSWRGASAPGLQAHTAFAPLQVSPASQQSQEYDMSGLMAALNQMHLLLTLNQREQRDNLICRDGHVYRAIRNIDSLGI
jgi:hypothetical protein